MRGLSASQVLDLCDHGQGRSWLSKAGSLLRVAWPEADEGKLRSAPVAAVDRALLRLRIRSFGQWLPLLSDCPSCSEQFEADIDLRALLSGAPENPPETVTLALGEDGPVCRPPTLEDVDAVSSLEPAEARRTLARRCVLGSADDIGDSLPAELSPALNAADPLAALSLRFECAECGSEWAESLDAVELLWSEVQAAGRRLIYEVHSLAAAYGWSEAEILSLTPTRRGMYLQRV